MQRVVKVIDSLNKVVGIVLALMLGTMSILILAQVFSRFVIDLPLTWSEELSRYLMIYVVFIGAGLAMRYNKLISIELLPESLQGTKRKVVVILSLLISIVFFVILFVQGMDILSRVTMQTSPALGLSMSIPYAAVPIGALLLGMNAVAAIFDELTSNKEDAQ